MGIEQTIGAMPVSLAEAQAFLRLEQSEEEALLAAMLRSAVATCEQFLGAILIERPVIERVGAQAGWQRLDSYPLRSISSVQMQVGSDAPVALSSADYEVDLDADGSGHLRLRRSSDGVAILQGRAGLASDANSVPEPIRQGILRLTAHFFTHRDGDVEPPMAVTALWRPYRRVRL